jgi:translation initiation factor IF-3
VRLIEENGKQFGIVSLKEAIMISKERGLDLVEVAPDANPPVCRLIDYGKYLYNLKKRAKDAKKRQHIIHVKEIKMKPTINKHDLEIKIRHAREFIEAGDKVKLTVIFKGRAITHPELGMDLLQRLKEEVSDIAVVEQEPKLENGRNMIMVLKPKGGKESAKAQNP